MSRFFQELEFEEPKYEGVVKPKTVAFWDKEKLKVALDQILDEIEKIKNGTSEFVPRAINPSKFGFPAENAVKIFVSNPSDKLFEGIREICIQDFMFRAGVYFHQLLKECREERPND